MNLKQWQDENRFSEGRTPFYVPRAMKEVVSATSTEWVSEYQKHAEECKALAMQCLDKWAAWESVPVVKNRGGEMHPALREFASALVELSKGLEWFNAWYGTASYNPNFSKAQKANLYFTYGIDQAKKLLEDASEYHTRRDWTEASDAWQEIYSRS